MISEKWLNAQQVEARYHANPAHHAQERRQRAFYSGLLEIVDVPDDINIIDLGCGPQSLLIDHPVASRDVRRFAVDPLTFDSGSEAVYTLRGITRVYLPIEHLTVASKFDEAWMYNVLQHVIDPTQCIDVAARLAPVVRIFEWVDQPLSSVHIHTFSTDWLRKELTRRSFKPYRETSGQSRLVKKWDQRFYAGVWKR